MDRNSNLKKLLQGLSWTSPSDYFCATIMGDNTLRIYLDVWLEKSRFGIDALGIDKLPKQYIFLYIGQVLNLLKPIIEYEEIWKIDIYIRGASKHHSVILEVDKGKVIGMSDTSYDIGIFMKSTYDNIIIKAYENI